MNGHISNHPSGLGVYPSQINGYGSSPTFSQMDREHSSKTSAKALYGMFFCSMEYNSISNHFFQIMFSSLEPIHCLYSYG